MFVFISLKIKNNIPDYDFLKFIKAILQEKIFVEQVFKKKIALSNETDFLP